MDLEHIIMQACRIAKEVGQFIRNERITFSQKEVKHKGIHNLVSYVDTQAEELLVKALGNLIPDAGFIAEENQALPRSETLNWIIDPLDGTTNFVHGVPVYSISIALMEHKEVIGGIVYEVNLDECFYTWKGSKAYLNGKIISVSETSTLAESLLATGFPYYDYSLMEPYVALFKDLMKNTQGIRRLGSAAVDLVYVACGRFELFYEYGLNSWDVAAGALIVRQAGGEVTDFKGQEDYIFGAEIIASNAHTHDEFLSMINHFFR